MSRLILPLARFLNWLYNDRMVTKEISTPLSPREKSARRYEDLNKIAVAFSELVPEFKEFAEKKWQGDITWRKLETFLKRKFGMSETPGQYDRYEALNRVADKFALFFEDFKEFAHSSGDQYMITWRKLETHLKRKDPEQAANFLKTVVESGGGSD